MNLNKINQINKEKLELQKEIEKIIKLNKYNLLNDLAPKIDSLFKKIYFNQIMELITNLNLTTKERFLFYINLSKCENISLTLKFEIIPILTLEFINNNKDSFLRLLNDEEVLNEFITWFKDFNLIDEISDEILSDIVKIPQIVNEVLSDNAFYIRNNSFKIFNFMPKKSAPSIAFYSRYGLDTYEKELEELYSKYFGTILSQKEQLELIKEQIKEVKKEDIFELGLIRLMPLYHFLEKIFNCKEYYISLKNVMKKTNLGFDTIIKFFYKYDTASFFKELCNKEIYSEDLTKKIEYLSYENCLLNLNNIENIEKMPLEELKKLPKEKNYNVALRISGGPRGLKGRIFKDGYEREIRRINRDGEMTILNARGIDHENAVKKIYPEIQFNKNCVMALERAVEAVRQLSSITFIIENESSYVVSSDNLSEEQIKSLNDLKIIDENNAKFGIITYDTRDENYKIAYNGESVSFDKLIEYMNSLNIKNKLI